MIALRVEDFEVAEKRSPLNTLVCGQYEQRARISHEASGQVVFDYALSQKKASAASEKKCINDKIQLKASDHD